MINTRKKSFDNKYRINRYVPYIYYKKYKNSEVSPFLIKDFNNKLFKNDYYEYPSYKFDFDISKTQPNFYNQYNNYKSKSNINKDSEIKENIYLQNFKEEEKKLKILNQNYRENYNDVMQKNIQTYPYGINLNISNIETQELIDIKFDNNLPKNSQGFNKYLRKRLAISKSFTRNSPNEQNELEDNDIKYVISQEKNNDVKINHSFDSHILNHKKKYKFYKYSKTCTNFHRDYCGNKKSYFKKVKLFIDILEEFMIQTIHIFFAFFIHRLKLYIKFKNIQNLENPFLLSKKLYKNNFHTYGQHINKKMINSKKKVDFISRNQKEQIKNTKELYIPYLKHANTPINLKMKVNTKKHVQFNQFCLNNRIPKLSKKLNASSDIKNNLNQNSNINLSTAFKSNGLKSTYSKSNYEISNNISNISLTPYKKNIELFSSEVESSFKNKLSRNRDFYDEELKESSNYMSAQIMYPNNNNLIYTKPKIGKQKIMKFDKKNNNEKFKNKIDSSIKSLIIKKKVIKPSNKLDEIKINSKSENNLSEIIVKQIQSIDKRINIFIKYIISESDIKKFIKEKIRRKILSLNKYRNIFINNDIDILHPVTTDSFDLGPVITILKTDIKNNDINDIFLNSTKKEKMINMLNIISRLYQKYIIYFYDFFLYEFENTDIYNISIVSNANILVKDDNDRFNKLNISCISNNMEEKNNDEIIVEDNYSLNNDIDINLLNGKEKIKSTKYLHDIEFINNMISSDNSENDNYNNKINQKRKTNENDCIKENDIDVMKNKLEKWNYGMLEEEKLLRTKIAQFKICKSILKNIRIKNDKKCLEKEKVNSIRKIMDLIKNKFSDGYKLLKHNFEIWRKNISTDLKQNKEKELNTKMNNDINRYPIILENKHEVQKINDKNCNIIYLHDSYSFKKFDSLEFEELLNYFRIYLISYFALRLRNIALSDDN